MNHYRHLTLEEREKILKFHILGYSIIQISKMINRHKSTISREIKRHSINGEYSACRANEEYLQNRINCHRKKFFG